MMAVNSESNRRRQFWWSRFLAVCGVVVSILLPWASQLNVREVATERTVVDTKPKRNSRILSNVPDPGEQPVFEHSVKVGAELSGAWLQDRDGFLWVGTFGGGLFRYDGTGLKRYSETSGDLIGSNVTALHQDTEGVIWIGTLSGISTYDKRTGEFSTIELFAEDSNKGVAGVWTFHDNGEGTLWIGTNGRGLIGYERSTGHVNRYVHDVDDATSIPNDNIYRIRPSREGKLLLATFGGGVARFDPKSKQVDLQLGVDDGLGSSQVWSVYEDSTDRLWIGTQDGLDCFDCATNELIAYEFVHDDETSLGGPIVTDVREDRFGTFWVTSFNGDASLSRLDERMNQFTRYGTRDSPPGELSQRGARTMFEDDSGIFWIVSLDGLVKFDKSSVGFSMVSFGSGLLPMYEDRAGTMWLGTISGLQRFDQKRRKSIPVSDETLGRELVTAFFEDSENRFWMGIYGGDLVEFDPENERVLDRHVPNQSDPQGIPESNCIRRILEADGQRGKLWLLTQGGGLVLYDPVSKTAQRFSNDLDDPNSICSDTASYGAILKDRDGSIWVGTDNGLDYWAAAERRFRHFWDGQPLPGKLQSGVIQALHRDENGTLWVGTSKGLHRLIDFDAGRFENFGVEQGLSDNNILGILESRDRLWLSTPNGITAFDPSGQVPPQVFRREDGRPEEDSYLLTSFFKTRDNEFWFGGPTGVTHFNPDRLARSEFIPPVKLTSLTQAGIPIKLDADPAHVREIRLHWPADHFEFQAAALSYSMPSLNRFRYRLEGLHSHWIESGIGSGRYSSLPGGSYLLRIQACNSAGVWNEGGTVLGVHVTPAFWKTQWFQTLTLLMGTLFLAGTARYVETLRGEISQRKIAEKRLEVSQARYRSIVEDQEDMIVRFDPEGIITFANQAYCRANGVTQGDVIGRHYSWRIHHEERDEIAQVLQAANEKAPQHFSESRAYRPDGSIAWESWVGRALYGSSGEIHGYQAVGRDITLLRQAELALEDKEAQLNHLSRISAIGEMAAGLSHEIRQPLAAISSLASAALLTMEKQTHDETAAAGSPLKSWMEDITDQTLRISSIITDVQSFARRDTKRQEVSIRKILDGSESILRHTTRHALGSLKIKCPADLPQLYVAPVQIEQVLVNLVTNACDAMENVDEPREVTIDVRQVDDSIKVVVDDTGPGISDDLAAAMFESFFTSKSKGLGLGLAISRSIIESHEGTIFAVPKQPGGRIVFMLPIAGIPKCTK